MQLLVRVHRRTGPLRNRHRSADQCQQSYRRGHLSHDGSPSCARPPSRFMVTGSSITKVRRPHVSFRCSSTSLTLAFSGPWQTGYGIVKPSFPAGHFAESAAALDRLPQPLHGEFEVLRLEMAPALDLGLVTIFRKALEI